MEMGPLARIALLVIALPVTSQSNFEGNGHGVTPYNPFGFASGHMQPPGYGDWRDVAYVNTVRRLYLSMMHDQFMERVHHHNMKKRAKWILTLIVSLGAMALAKLTSASYYLCQALGITHGQHVEYETLYTARRYTIRKYESAVAAQICGLSDDEAFSKLARYAGYRTILLPHNRERGRIERTLPIINTRSRVPMGAESSWFLFNSTASAETEAKFNTEECMQWILPNRMTLYDAPKPFDRRVQLVGIPGRSLAVSRWFNGKANTSTILEKAENFLTSLEKDGCVIDRSRWQLHRYNDPLTIPRYRRNEIAVPILNAIEVIGGKV
mmetsp:Transcript_34437/g.83300  ORF Transcript_34437/g.83300 Transcript_34437/m.83300 type:complete len:325 (-) Transcript_34437:182-1156(-)